MANPVAHLKAGRELSALVAEWVMGCQVIRFVDGLGQNSARCGCGIAQPHNTQDGPACGFLLDYPTDIAAAWTVVEKVLDDYHGCPWPLKLKAREHHYGFRLEKHTEAQGQCETWRAQFCEVTAVPPHEEMNFGVAAEADSAPLAICLAALRAVGYDQRL